MCEHFYFACKRTARTSAEREEGVRGSGKAGPVGREDWKLGEAGRETLPSQTGLSWRLLAGSALTSFHLRPGYQERPKNQCVSKDSGFQTGDHDLLDSDEINQLVKISILSE